VKIRSWRRRRSMPQRRMPLYWRMASAVIRTGSRSGACGLRPILARNEHSCHSRQSSVFPFSGCVINLRFEHPVFHPMICYFKGLFACATSRAIINAPPDQCYERVLAQAFWVLHCLSQVSEYMRTIATLPLVTASLILGQIKIATKPIAVQVESTCPD
jgi:hypothetical protein